MNMIIFEIVLEATLFLNSIESLLTFSEGLFSGDINFALCILFWFHSLFWFVTFGLHSFLLLECVIVLSLTYILLCLVLVTCNVFYGRPIIVIIFQRHDILLHFVIIIVFICFQMD